MIGLCFGAVLGVVEVFLPATAFTLAWTHSVERVTWQEDYRVAGARLVLVEARVKGSGAGMEPPGEAVLRGGWWRYRPDLPPLDALRLTRSSASEDYRLCVSGDCRPLSALVPLPESDGAATVVWSCRHPS